MGFLSTRDRAFFGMIAERMPDGLRKRWPGYGLNRLAREPENLNHLLAGSEGTLAAILSAALMLEHLSPTVVGARGRGTSAAKASGHERLARRHHRPRLLRQRPSGLPLLPMLPLRLPLREAQQLLRRLSMLVPHLHRATDELIATRSFHPIHAQIRATDADRVFRRPGARRH